MEQNNIDYRLTFTKHHITHEDVEVKYFDNVESAFSFIKENQIYTFSLVKEEIVAQRWDGEVK